MDKNSRWLVGGFALSGLYLITTLWLFLSVKGAGGADGFGIGLIFAYVDLPGKFISYPFTFLWSWFYDANILLSFLSFLRTLTVALGSAYFYFLVGAFLFGRSPSRWDRNKYSVGTILAVIFGGTFFVWLFLSLFFNHSVVRNSTNCDSQQDEFTRNNCFTHLALQNKDPSLCKDNSCFENLAYLGDASLCNKLPAPDLQNMCIAITKGDGSYCPTQFGEHRDSCYYFVALKRKDKAVCEKITDQFNRTQCEEDYNR